jgi:hypothetical protein
MWQNDYFSPIVPVFLSLWKLYIIQLGLLKYHNLDNFLQKFDYL